MVQTSVFFPSQSRLLAAAVIVTCTTLAQGSMPAFGQGRPPPFGAWSKTRYGSTTGLPRPVSPNSLSDKAAIDRSDPVHVTLAGQPCVTIFPLIAPDIAIHGTFFHNLLASNACSARITLQACYYATSDCVIIQLPPYGRTETTLGMIPGVKEFRFEYREQMERQRGGLELRTD